MVPYFLGRVIGTSLAPNLELVYCQLQKRKGGDHAGILISIIISIVSKVGTNLLLTKGKLETEFIKKQVNCIELILGMEEFLKYGCITHKELKLLLKTMINYINHIKSYAREREWGHV